MFNKFNKDRIITGMLLIFLVVIIALIDNFFFTWLFLGIVFMFGFYEAMKLFNVKENSPYLFALVLWIFSYFYPNPDDLIFIALIVFTSVMVFKQNVNFKLISTLIYPAGSFLFLLALYKDFGIEALIWLVIVVASTDIGAYFTGKSIGKRKFCKVSPNKTWEGVIGGVLIASILGTIYGVASISVPLSFCISFFVSVASIFGDLFESYLKREAGVKDSGNILPGHGGILDRMDGYMFAAVIMVVLLRGFA